MSDPQPHGGYPPVRPPPAPEAAPSSPPPPPGPLPKRVRFFRVPNSFRALLALVGVVSAATAADVADNKPIDDPVSDGAKAAKRVSTAAAKEGVDAVDDSGVGRGNALIAATVLLSGAGVVLRGRKNSRIEDARETAEQVRKVQILVERVGAPPLPPPTFSNQTLKGIDPKPLGSKPAGDVQYEQTGSWRVSVINGHDLPVRDLYAQVQVTVRRPDLKGRTRDYRHVVAHLGYVPPGTNEIGSITVPDGRIIAGFLPQPPSAAEEIRNARTPKPDEEWPAMDADVRPSAIKYQTGFGDDVSVIFRGPGTRGQISVNGQSVHLPNREAIPEIPF